MTTKTFHTPLGPVVMAPAELWEAWDHSLGRSHGLGIYVDRGVAQAVAIATGHPCNVSQVQAWEHDGCYWVLDPHEGFRQVSVRA